MHEDKDFKPKYNGYKCIMCTKTFITVDLAEGSTPMTMTCMSTEGCGGQAVTLGYPKKFKWLGNPLLLEFVKPSVQDLARIKHPGMLAYFARGGLIRRPVDTAPDWVKKLA